MKIFCIGRNYVAHARELGNEVPKEPVIFMKPASALVRNGKAVYYPGFTSELHYEGELVVRIARNGRSVQERFARKYYDEVGLGFDLTARDIQRKLKEKGLPWEISKGFDGSAPVSAFFPVDEVVNKRGHFDFTIEKNGELVQIGDTSLMIFPIDRLIAAISRYFILQKGDLIFTGTPAGVGPVQKGDRLRGRLAGREVLETDVR